MAVLDILHLHLHHGPETLHLLQFAHGHHPVQLVQLVVEFHVNRRAAILPDPRNLAAVNLAGIYRDGFHHPAVMAVPLLLAKERVLVVVHASAAHVVIGEVGAHEIVRLGRGTADTAGLLHGRQVQPLVVLLPRLVVVPGEKTRSLHISGIGEEHDLFGVLALVHGPGDHLPFAFVAVFLDQRKLHLGVAVFPVGTVFNLLDDITAALGIGLEGSQQKSGR